MSWAALLELIAEEVGRDSAARIEARARAELGGVRLTVSMRAIILPVPGTSTVAGARGALTAADIDAVAPGRPAEAARKLGVSPRTAYRALQRRLIR